MKDPYLYPHSDVLINRLGITDRETLSAAESDLVRTRIVEAVEKAIPGNFDQKHLQAIHRHLFQDVYYCEGEHVPAFAGAVRVIGIEKATDTGIHYPHPEGGIESLKNRLDYAFTELKKDRYLQGLESEPDLFARKLARHTAELWECHPFRDGNTRSTYFFADHLARDAGLPFRDDSLNIAEFRRSVADYVRGDRGQFVDLISSYIEPARELSLTDTVRVDESRESFTVTPGVDTNHDVTVAAATLFRAVSDLLAQKQKEFELSLKPLYKRLGEAEKRLAALEKDPPRGMIGSGKASAAWRTEKSGVEKELRVASRAIKAALADRGNTASWREYEAQELVSRRFPREADLVRQAKVQTQAQGLLERWRSLETGLSQLSGESTTLNGAREMAMRQSLSQVFDQVRQSDRIRAVLGEDLVSRMQVVAKDNSRELGVLRERSGLGTGLTD